MGRQGVGGDVVARCGEVGREGGQQGGGGDVVARCGEVGRQGGQHGGEGGKGSLTSIEDNKSSLSDLVLFICKKTHLF